MLQKTALFVLCRILASKGALYMTLCYYREGSTPQLFQISESKSMKELLRPSMIYIFILPIYREAFKNVLADFVR